MARPKLKKKPKPKNPKTLEGWKAELEHVLKRRTGCTWADLCGDKGPRERAFEAGQTPEEFTTEWIDRYDLMDFDNEPWL